MAELDSQTAGLIINLIVGVVTLFVCVILFDLFRRKVPSIFEARRALHVQRLNLDYYGNRVYSPPPPSNLNFGWLAPVWRLELDTVAETHGLDTALYLRYLRSMAGLFLILCLPCIPLCIIYGTATNKDIQDETQRPKGVQILSLSNVNQDDPWRFWVTLGIEFIVLTLCCWVIKRDFTIYAKYRKKCCSNDNPSNYSILVQDIPRTSYNKESIYAYWDKIFPGEVIGVYHAHDASRIVTEKENFWHSVTKRERAEWDMAFQKKLGGARPTHKVGTCACCRGASAKVDSISYWSEEQKRIKEEIVQYQQGGDNSKIPPTNAAFIVFVNRRTAAIAAQTNFASDESSWRVSKAPEPNAINWNSLSIPRMQVAVRSCITILLSILLVLFWIIPVTFIMSLVNLSKLADIEIGGSKPFSFLANVNDWSPALSGFIQSFLPAIILSVFLGLIPTFFRMFISVSRVPSNGKVDRLVRDWFFTFLIFSNFLFVIVAGSLLDDLAKIIQEPSQIVSFLAQSAPKQGAFMMNFVLLKALSETPQGLLQIGRVALRFLKLRFLMKTPRERQNVETSSTVFQFFRYYGMAQLITLLGLVYSTIAPLIVPICFLYFAVLFIVSKYNLCFSMYNVYQDGGLMYGGALYGTWVGLFLHLLTVIGLFGLNKNPAQSVLVIVPAVIAVVFIMYCRKSFSRTIYYGSALDTQLRVEEEGVGDKIPITVADSYIHPGFIPLPHKIENLNGVNNDNNNEGTDDVEDPESVDVIPAEDVLETETGVNQATSMSTEDWKDAYGSMPDVTADSPP